MPSPPLPGPPPRVRLRPPSPAVRRFLATESGGAVLLLLAAVVALLWANSPWAASYDRLWETRAGLSAGGWALEMDLRHWVNDAAMALFFLVVGLEITREVVSGELRGRRSVAVPTLGAIGGLVTPPLVYLLINPSGEAARGWGIVMSTDTAFVIGVLALFGPRCPDRLRLFLLTLAIADDVGAISAMALFYTDELFVPALLAAVAVVLVILAMRWAGLWRLPAYLVAGAVLWFAVHASGVHATLAGVVLGLILPARPTSRDQVERLPAYGRALLERPDAERAEVAALAARSTVPPNARLEQRLHPVTAYVVVPVFGLANAGVGLDPESLREAAASPVTIGVAVALVVGNAIGITAASALALRSGWGVLPGGVRYSHLLGGATLAGIGFTISLFITTLAFDDRALQDQAKIGILAGSLLAAVLGTVLLRTLGERTPLCTPDDRAELPPLPPRPWREPSRTG